MNYADLCGPKQFHHGVAPDIGGKESLVISRWSLANGDSRSIRSPLLSLAIPQQLLNTKSSLLQRHDQRVSYSQRQI